MATPRDLNEIRAALRAEGIVMEPTAVAVAALRLVRKKVLQRIREKGRWRYSQR